MTDPLDERPWPDVLDQRAVVDQQALASELDADLEEDQDEGVLAPLGGIQANAADVLDQRRVALLAEDEQRDVEH
jgi:hypothetical protein